MEYANHEPKDEYTNCWQPSNIEGIRASRVYGSHSLSSYFFERLCGSVGLGYFAWLYALLLCLCVFRVRASSSSTHTTIPYSMLLCVLCMYRMFRCPLSLLKPINLVTWIFFSFSVALKLLLQLVAYTVRLFALVIFCLLFFFCTHFVHLYLVTCVFCSHFGYSCFTGFVERWTYFWPCMPCQSQSILIAIFSHLVPHLLRMCGVWNFCFCLRCVWGFK